LSHLDDWSPKTNKTPDDLRKEKEAREKAEREAEAQRARERAEKGGW